MQQHLHNPKFLFSSISSSTVHPLAVHLNMLMNTLSEAPRDDVKFQVLKEISENIDDLFGTPEYSSLIEGLICIFMRLLHETAPQFIAENNTLQLRKLMLELLFRLSSNDVVKSYSKSLQQILLRLIYMENEENALLIIKILTDHIKIFRPSFTSELTNFFIQWKNAYTEMLKHSTNELMFLQRPFNITNRTIEESVVEALQSCYFTTTLTYSQQQKTSGEIVTPSLEKYTLIPKANQSVKVLAEMSVFLLVLIQMHRQHLLGEVLDLIPIFLRYINIKLPQHLKTEKLYNRELVDEFHNSQVRALSFIGYTAKQSQIATILNEHTKLITDAILMLIDSFHSEVITQRRELLMALKYLFQSEFRTNFIVLIPKMCDEKSLLGSSFTSQDQLRNQSYSLLADILHHIRMNIPHLLKHIFFLCSRCLHNHQLLPYVQTMYGKLMMNLIEPLIIQSKENGSEIARLILCNSINSFLRKAKLIANFHLPLLKEKFCKNIHQQQQQQIKLSEKINESINLQSPNKSSFLVEGQQEMTSEVIGSSSGSGGGVQKHEKNLSSVEATRAFWRDPILPLSLNDCKNLIRFIIQPIKMMIIALKEIGIEQEPNIVFKLEHDLLELFPTGLICLDIFIIGTNVLQGVGGGNVYQHKTSSSNIRSKEEKETLDAFIGIYTNIGSLTFERILEQNIEV